MGFKYTTFSKKQLQLMTWWVPNSPHKNKVGVIAEGAVRSGKTLVCSISFVFWGMQKGSGLQFAICGKTIGSLERNLINQLIECVRLRGYRVSRRENCLTISDGKNTNRFYLFGGRDERSQDLVQGITLAGCLLDEVALMPRSFVEQVLARCSVDGSKYWFNCNPEGPNHWFYQEHVLQSDEKGYLRIHFNLEDNPSLTEEVISRYHRMFTGVFYRRFILGEWTAASGVIYDCFTYDNNTYQIGDKQIPWQIREGNVMPFYGCDYGTYNPCVFLEAYYFRGVLYIENEYQYDGRRSMRQKTDLEYTRDFQIFRKDHYRAIIVDPSASSFITSLVKNGEKVMKAKNEVYPGIQKTYRMLNEGAIKINKDKCPGLIKEIGMYIWNQKRADTLGKEDPVKANDHFCDALRYIVSTIVPDYQSFGEINRM